MSKCAWGVERYVLLSKPCISLPCTASKARRFSLTDLHCQIQASEPWLPRVNSYPRPQTSVTALTAVPQGYFSTPLPGFPEMCFGNTLLAAFYASSKVFVTSGEAATMKGTVSEG